MCFRRIFAAIARSSLCGLAIALLMPSVARAAGECNGLINISYPDFPAGPSFTIPPLPAPLKMRINLGTGSITGGLNNTLTVTSFSLDMACNADFPLLPGCVPDGPPNFPPKKVDFIAMTQDNCAGSVFTPTIVNTPQLDSNQVIFTANPPLVIPKNQPLLPGFCSVEFTLQVLEGFSSDMVTPDQIEEVAGYNIAKCDNGVLVSSGSQTSSIQVMQPPPEDFTCYETKAAVNFDPTNPRPVNPIASLVDTFGSSQNIFLARVRRLCAPATKTAVQPGQTEHLMGYEVGSRGSTTFKPVKGVKVHSQQFGDLTVDVVNFATRFPLLVPSSKIKNPPPNVFPPPNLNPSDHFQCYETANPKGSIPTGVPLVTDQFGSQAIRLFSPKGWRLCVPVDKNGGDPNAPTNNIGLFCYLAETIGGPANNPVKGVTAAWANQIEPTGNDAALDNIDDFCVTATITKP